MYKRQYCYLYVAYRNVSTSVIGRNSAIATAKFAMLNIDNGVGTKQELAQAEEQYYNFRARLSSALAGSNVLGDERQGVYGSERALRELMGLAPTDGLLIRPIEEPTLARVQFDWEEIVAQMLYLSPELRKGRTVIKQRELEEVSAKNQLLPEVNLSLLYRWVGVGDTLGPPSRRNVGFPSPGSSALAELTGGDYQEGAVRLEITPPAIGSRREKTRVRGAQLRLHQSRAFLQDAERLLVSQLSDAVAKTATHYQLVQTHAMRWQAAEQEVEARLAEFQGGRGTVNVVLQSQLRRADAQISYYRALGEYNKSINYVDYLKGTLLANNNISLAEGPWNQKAYWDALERARERSAGKMKKYGVTRPGVVRQGPLLDPRSTTEIIGSGIDGVEGIVPDEVILEGGAATELEMDPYNGSVDVEDTPLGEMGDSTNQMLQSREGGVDVDQLREVPDDTSLPEPQSIRDPSRSNLRSPSGPPNPDQGVIPISYHAEPQTDNAPQAVRRMPLPEHP